MTAAPELAVRHFPVRYTADGYELYVGTAAALSGCRGEARGLASLDRSCVGLTVLC
jgi:hypothetical protein